jgi:hypothetical protein
MDGKVWLLENPYNSENGKRRREGVQKGREEERKDLLQATSYLSNPKVFTDIL